MKGIISDKTIENISMLTKLQLSQKEKEQAKKDIGTMLHYIDKLNELDTDGVEPIVDIFPRYNMFREDIVTNQDQHEMILANAPASKGQSFKVPKTID